ncbi:MAG: LPS ABC transporter substrate-binding protein LptA [Desulfovibrionaceae bacterium]|nr:LPS ABC transporter substrate-binding protein LptA [Desulfovibrionaceae bacterium]
MLNLRALTILLALAALLMPSLAAAQEWGEIREAAVNLNVREKPDRAGEHVLTLAKGQRVKTDFMTDDGWVAVFNLNEKTRDLSRAVGYANAKYLKVISHAATSAGQAAVTAPDKPVVSTPSEVPSSSGEGEVSVPVTEQPTLDPIRVGVDPSRIPVKITSDRMTYDESGKVVSFVGNVVAEHGQLTLWADSLSAYLASKSGKKFTADSVDRIVAEGNVKVKKETTEGTCGKLTYFVDPQLLKMEDEPLLQDGPNSLTGEIINFNIRENRSEVEGGKKRVKAIFMTPETLKVQ